jgi:dTMP kinase
MPDCVFVLDMSPESATSRMNRSLDRMETQGDEFRERLRSGFLDEAARAPETLHVIDAGQPIEAVHADIWQIASKLLQLTY